MRPAFDPDRIIGRLERFGHALPGLVSVLTDEDARWKPDPTSWSVLEIVCHLVDEEVGDFRTRVLSTLDDPRTPWPPIDPQGWATERDYQSRDLGSKLTEFTSLRAQSVQLLRAIESPDWDRAYTHLKIGDLSAGYMLSCWAAHDALHLRQISKRLMQLAQRDGADDELRYAGSW